MDMLPPSGVRPRSWLSQSGVNLPKKIKVALVTTPTGKNNSDDFRQGERGNLDKYLRLIFTTPSAQSSRWGFFYFSDYFNFPIKVISESR